MSKPVIGRASDNMGRFFSCLEGFDCLEEKFSDCNHSLVASGQMLLATVIDGAHGFRSAGVMNEKGRSNSNKGLGFLSLSI